MLVRGVEDIQAVSEQAALLRIAMLVARDEPLESLFARVSEEVGRLLGVEAGAVMRFVGGERAVIVGVYRDEGRARAAGQRRARLPPHRQRARTGAEHAAARRGSRPTRARRGELPMLMKSVGLKATVAAPVLRRGEAWGALVASAAEEESLPPGLRAAARRRSPSCSPRRSSNADARAELAASRTRLVEAGDEVRRRLERALHEGAHQHVVALALKLRVACGRAMPGSEEEALLADVLADAMEASAAMGELARGLHPAVLSERGLAAALQVLVARAAVPDRTCASCRAGASAP